MALEALCAAIVAGALLFARTGATARAASESIVFREEALPAGTPAGWHAVTFTIPGQVISGVATSFTLRRQAWSLHGSPLRLRFGRGNADQPSHVLLPPSVPLPSGVRRLPRVRRAGGH